MQIAITGGSGLIGSELSRSLTERGHDVIHLVRREPTSMAEVKWDPEDGRVDTSRLAGVEAVVHLAGAPLGPARWTDNRKSRIRDSRIQGTRTLATALAAMSTPPTRLVLGSAVGFYGDTGSTAVTEDGPRGRGFLAELVEDWEAQTIPAERVGISVAHARTGVVLARSGGLLGAVLPLYRAGLGAKLGNGRQFMSWISLADEVDALRFLLERPDITGAVNLTAPEPVVNAHYTKEVGRALRRPALLSVPGFAIRAVLGDFADEAALVSQRVLPKRLLDAGYTFRHSQLRAALADLLAD